VQVVTVQSIFYILFYFKCYPTFDLAAVWFDFDRSQANRWVHHLQPILEKVLGEKKLLPLTKNREYRGISRTFSRGERSDSGWDPKTDSSSQRRGKTFLRITQERKSDAGEKT
jgi:Helix-turn-helix of DDE superfamily endonuclease